MFLRQPVEQDDLVQPVEELGAEMPAHHIHHLRFDIRDLLVIVHIGEILAAEIAGQDDQRIAEIDHAALPVGQPPVVEHLQQHVEHVAMRLLDLVEQHHLVGAPADRFGQHAAFLVADIARGRADQPGDRVLLHELAHVDAHHRAVVVEQEAGKRLGQFGLADTGRAEEQEAAQRPAGILQARARAAHRLGHCIDRLALADHALGEDVLHVEQLFALAFHHAVDRNTGPAADNTGDIVFGDLFLEQRIVGVARRFRELLLQFGDPPVLQFARLLQVTAALRLFEFDPRLVEIFLDPRFGVDLVALVLPARGQFARLLFEFGQFLAQVFEPVLRGGVGFLLQRLLLDSQLDDAAVEILDFLGLAFHFHADAAGGLVHQVDRLVGQEAVLDIAVGQLRRGDDRAIGNPHAVVQLVLVLDPAQDADRVLDAGLVDEDRLEAPLQRGVLLDIFLVFIERGRADAMQLAAAERGLEQIARIHAALARARADQRVHFVDEQDDLPFGALHLVEHGLEPFLELAAVLRPGDQRAHVERHQRAALEAVGNIAIGDTQREAFGDRGFAGAGFADERGIVLGPAREDLHGAADFLVAADHRVELAVACCLRQVAGVFLHRVVAFFRPRAVGGAATGDFLDRGLERLGVDARGGQRLACRIVGQRERLQQALDGDETVARLFGKLFGLVERAHRIIV